jgi:hypothetical protein
MLRTADLIRNAREPASDDYACDATKKPATGHACAGAAN